MYMYRFSDINNTARLIPRITEYACIGDAIVLKTETEHDCKVEFIHYNSEEALVFDLENLQTCIEEFYSTQKEPMGYNTEAVGYRIEPEDDYDEEDRSRVGYC